jgi:hypothetical protein
LFSHAKRLGVKAVITSQMKQTLGLHFKNFSIPQAAEDCYWNWTVLNIAEIYQLTPRDFEDKNYLIHWYVFDVSGFRMHQNQLIKEEFVFHDDVKQMAESFIKTSAQSFMNFLGKSCFS